MQQTHPFFLIGTVIQERYIIEDVLGKGGSSTVYLVRDLHASNEVDKASELVEQPSDLFALKVLTEQDPQEKNRFMFEHVMLQWLDHPALPRVHSMFEDKNHAYMLMDYIAGPTLETLRRQQEGKHFSLEQVLTLLSPIVAAISYLHRQQPPIIHCDIKPSNIVVSQDGDKAVLVDFGIAKEYDPDATITAIRQCSQGFSAPEQYSNSMRTDQRTDIYGLAATCYVLLTGITPIDALRRVTSLAGKESDPLVPLDALVPTLPVGAREAIQRALSVSSNERFATIEEFWRALQDTSETKGKESSEALVQSGTSYAPQPVSAGQTHPAHHLQRTALAIHMVLTFLLIIGFGFWTYAAQHHPQAQQAASSSLSVAIAQQPTSTASTSSTYAHLVTSYQGTVHNIPMNVSTQMYLLQVLQSSQNIQGTFKGLNRSDPFVGVLDVSKHIFFTVDNTGSAPLFFQGTVRTDGNLAGTYCALDTAGQCTGEYGIWSVGPEKL